MGVIVFSLCFAVALWAFDARRLVPALVLAAGCGGSGGALQNSAIGAVFEGPPQSSIDAAMLGCWYPISSKVAPAVIWTEDNGYGADSDGEIFVGWHGGQRIADTQFANAVDAYWQLVVTSRPDLTAYHVNHCNAYLRAAGL